VGFLFIVTFQKSSAYNVLVSSLDILSSIHTYHSGILSTPLKGQRQFPHCQAFAFLFLSDISHP
jgi:hypothetical protein